MAKKSKHMKGSAFSIEVCDAIRHHIGERKALESKRKNAFEDRDAAKAEKDELEDHESPEYSHACLKHSDAIDAIENLNHAIKHHNNQIDQLVEQADEPKFEFAYDVPPPTKKADGQMKLGEGEKPVKVIGKAGPVKPEKPDPELGDGVDEHLKASVNDLDLSKAVVTKLTAAGFTKVGHITVVLDAKDGDLATAAGLTDPQEREVMKTVKTYRKAHRDAARKAEGDPLGN